MLDTPPHQHGDLVVDDLGEPGVVATADIHPSSGAPQSRGRPEGGGADVCADQIERLHGRLLGLAREQVLPADQQRTHPGSRQLHRPALPGAVTKAHTPAREP